MCTQPGMVKNTYGTGCFMLMHIGEKPIVSRHNLLTTVAWKMNGKTQYALEGSVFIAGAVIQWLRDSLKIIDTSNEVEKLALSVESSDGVYVIPAFAGLGAPHWNQHARGTIFGLTRGSTDAHIARAALESIAYQTMDILKAMEADAGISIRELRVDGGATVNNLLMGAAYLAGLAVGYWKGLEEIQGIWQADVQFHPTRDREKIERGIKGWNKAIQALLCWTNLNN